MAILCIIFIVGAIATFFIAVWVMAPDYEKHNWDDDEIIPMFCSIIWPVTILATVGVLICMHVLWPPLRKVAIKIVNKKKRSRDVDLQNNA